MTISLRRAAAVLLLGLVSASPSHAAEKKLRFAVGPFLPTPTDTRKSYEPFFQFVARALDAEYDLAVTVDWAGIAVALANDQVDLAWMGPWGYVLAAENGQARAIATVKYDGKPTYHAIVVGRPDLDIKKWPDDAKGLRISFADVGSTSGWLIPT
jgi:phosphonate transport system substrate-binding protein